MFHQQLLTRKLSQTYRNKTFTILPSIQNIQHINIQPFSKKAQQKSKQPQLSLHEQQKQAKTLLKEKRQQKYHSKMERQMTLKYRRMSPDKIYKKNYLKQKFKSWFDKKRDWEQIQDTLAKKSGRFDNLDATDAFEIKVAVIVERFPLIIPDEEDWEKNFLELQEYLDSFKYMYPEDTPYAQLNKDGEGLATGMLARTEKTFWKSITKDHDLLPRITEADELNDTNSLNRKLHTKLFLTTPQNVNDDNNDHNDDDHHSTNKYNVFPTTTVHKSETLIEACKRAVKETVGEDLELYCPSNAPMGMNLYLHDHDKSQFWGEKVFFVKCHRDIGDVDPMVLGREGYAWLDREEIVEMVRGVRGEYDSKMYHYLL